MAQIVRVTTTNKLPSSERTELKFNYPFGLYLSEKCYSTDEKRFQIHIGPVIYILQKWLMTQQFAFIGGFTRCAQLNSWKHQYCWEGLVLLSKLTNHFSGSTPPAASHSPSLKQGLEVCGTWWLYACLGIKINNLTSYW